MISFNKRNNFSNPHQGQEKKVLTVCSAGLLRSPTAAFVIQKEFGHNTRSAGVDERYALVFASEELVCWADELVFMEFEHQRALGMLYPEWKDKIIHNGIVLGVPDSFARMDERLQQLIIDAYKERTSYED